MHEGNYQPMSEKNSQRQHIASLPQPQGTFALNYQNHSPDEKNNLKNAYDIIYDQAKSIQFLQEEIVMFQKQLETTTQKLIVEEEKNRNCTCSKNSGERLKVSTGTNTSHELINNQQHADNNSNKSFKRNSSENGNLIQRPKSEEDFRFENFLNENSINFPKQFLDIESKNFDSHIKEESYHPNQNNFYNSSSQNISNINLVEKNLKLMQNMNIFNNNRETSILTNRKSANKWNIVPNSLSEKNVTENYANSTTLNHYTDITDNSLDPPSQMFFLRVPSMLCKTNSSVLCEDREISRKKVKLPNFR